MVGERPRIASRYAPPNARLRASSSLTNVRFVVRAMSKWPLLGVFLPPVEKLHETRRTTMRVGLY